MEQSVDIFSPQAEHHLKQTLVSAVNHEQVGHSTKLGGLKGCEHAACLANMTRPQYLSLCIYFGLNVSVRDIEELQMFVVTNHIMKQHWYGQGDYYSDWKMQRRINGLALAAIKNLTPNKKEKPTSAEVANIMEFSTSALNKATAKGDKWSYRYQAACRYLQGELEGAANVVHKNSMQVN